MSKYSYETNRYVYNTVFSTFLANIVDLDANLSTDYESLNAANRAKFKALNIDDEHHVDTISFIAQIDAVELFNEVQDLLPENYD